MNKKRPKVQNRSTKGDIPIRDLPRACADERAAVEFMERQRWGDVPCCPRCGSTNVYAMKDSKTGDRQANFRWRCKDCKGTNTQFTVRTGTVFEDSRIPLMHWCFAFWRAATSKKGVSALEIKRQTGLSYKSSLFLLHRIRYAMSGSAPAPLKGDVEVDETYVGGKPRYRIPGKRGPRAEGESKKVPVVALVERQGKVKVRRVASVTAKTVRGLIRASVDQDSRIITDESRVYHGIGEDFLGGHVSVKHSAREYVRGDIHSNTVESFFAIVKRGLNGIYHAVSKEHLHRYLAEYEFRYNNRELEDGQRVVAAIRGANGKRLMYRQPIARANG